LTAPLDAAAQAPPEYRRRSAEEVAGFLESIALKIEARGDELIAGERADDGPVAHVRRSRAREFSFAPKPQTPPIGRSTKDCGIEPED
jgi:acyl-CoA reductase-like NAD-dependent aldehyde dehydrogenase